MSRYLGRFALVLTPVALLLWSAPAALADTMQQCIDKGMATDGEPPTCVKGPHGWEPVASTDGFGDSGGGIPSGFVGLMVVVALLGIAFTVWKVSTARRLATEAGMDPGLATKMTLLTDDGLDATYLAASMRRATPPPSPGAPLASGTAARRLKQLQELLDDGLVTQTEYDERRKAIIDSV